MEVHAPMAVVYGPAGRANTARARLAPVVAVFLGSALLFTLEPIVAKRLLPSFGGSATLWTTCQMLFCSLLLAAYLFAHLVARVASLSATHVVQSVLVLSGLAFVFSGLSGGGQYLLNLSPSADGGSPLLSAATSVIFGVGLPFFGLAASAPLLQHWFRGSTGLEPYRLYAASNVGSLLAVLSYPFLLEPSLPVSVQERYWLGGFAVFVLLLVASRPSNATFVPEPFVSPRDTRGDWLWIALSAAGATVLMATTNQLCLDIAVVPFLWLVPLALYLISFILAFDHPQWYWRPVVVPVMVVAAVLALLGARVGPALGIAAQVVVFTLFLFAGTLALHGEAVRRRPPGAELTRFYLSIAAGGAIGSVAVGVIAPLTFSGFWELPVGIWVAVALVGISIWPDILRRWPSFRPRVLAGALAAVVMAGLGVLVVTDILDTTRGALVTRRNFYGTLRVTEKVEGGRRVKRLYHGRILHGEEYDEPRARPKPTSYYTVDSGVALAMARNRLLRLGRPPRSLRIGVIGLGTGTLASYASDGDSITFYEINRDVIDLAAGPRAEFSYVAECPAKLAIVPGDARLSLATDTTMGPFDIVVVDAFSGDAVPVHLLTLEALDLYLKQLAPTGVIAFHISNRFLDLAPQIGALAAERSLYALGLMSPANSSAGAEGANWLLLAYDPAALDVEVPSQVVTYVPVAARRVWTDDFSDLVGALRRGPATGS